MTNLRKKFWSLAGILLFFGLSGCGYDVELNMPGGELVAETLGIGKKQDVEPQMSERGPLVAPPNVKNLPQPGSNKAVAAAEQWPNDPDKQARAIEAELDANKEPKISEEERLRQLALTGEDPTESRLFTNKKVNDKYRKAESDEDSDFPTN